MHPEGGRERASCSVVVLKKNELKVLEHLPLASGVPENKMYS